MHKFINNYDIVGQNVGQIRQTSGTKSVTTGTIVPVVNMLKYVVAPAAAYLSQILSKYPLSRSLRSSSPITIFALFRKTSMATSKSFSSPESRRWNKLSTQVSSPLTLPFFRRHLKNHFSLMFTLVSHHQPSKLKVPYRLPNAFQPSAYDKLILGTVNRFNQLQL